MRRGAAPNGAFRPDSGTPLFASEHRSRPLLTLALGIGGNTAMFTVINAVLLRPLPFPQPDRLVLAWGSHPDIGHEDASLPDFTDWRAQNEVFAGMAASSLRSINITTRQGPERVIGARVTADLFRVLGVGPALGRDFRPDEDAPGAPPVAILSHGLWVRTLGADPAIIGRPITLNGTQYTVIGVMPPGFAMPPRAELRAPLAMSAAGAARRFSAGGWTPEARRHDRPGPGADDGHRVEARTRVSRHEHELDDRARAAPRAAGGQRPARAHRRSGRPAAGRQERCTMRRSSRSRAGSSGRLGFGCGRAASSSRRMGRRHRRWRSSTRPS